MPRATDRARPGFSRRRRTEYSYQRLAERHVDAHRVPVAHQLVAEAGPHAEQHLELVRVRRQAGGPHARRGLLDQVGVVRRDRRVGADRDQPLERRHPRRAHLVEALQRHRGRLDVDALADAHPRRQAGQRLDVAGRAPQHRLQHDAEVARDRPRAARGRRRGCRSVVEESSMSISTVVPLGGGVLGDARRSARGRRRGRCSGRAPVGFTLTSPSRPCSRRSRRAPPR